MEPDDGEGLVEGVEDGAPEQSEPQVIEVSEDSHLKLPGSDEAFPYSEFDDRYIRKSDYTRTRQQETARLREFEQEAQRLRAENQRYAQWYRQQAAGNGQGGQQRGLNPFESVMKQAEDRGYVAPADMRAAVEYATQQANPQMMGVLRMMAGTVHQLQTRVNESALEQANERIDRTVEKMASDHDMPQRVLRDAMEAVAERENWNPRGGESFEDFANRVAAEYKKDFDKHRASRQKRDRERDREEREAGLQGRGGRATPGRRLKVDPSKSIEDLVAEDEARGMFKE